MSRRMQFLTLSVVVGISVVSGMLITTTLYRIPPVGAEAAGLGTAASTAPLSQAIAIPSFADIAERANPGVVAIRNVEITKVQRQPQLMDPFHFFFGPDDNRRRRGGENDRQTPGEDDEERRQEGSGSGFIIQKDGYILTNNHVVDGASKITVTLDDGQRFDAVLKGKDESTDVALLKINCPHDLPTIPLGDSDVLRIGEWVMAIGNPLGSELGDEHSVTIGVVSAKGRQLRDLNRDFSLANYIQTDAAINFGNSGGPLLNARGEVIGINTAITRNYGNVPGLIQGIGFALPINMAKGVLDQLMSTGKVARGALSISVSPITDDKQKYYNLPSKKGAFVENVNRDGPAARAGLESGDIILSVDGKEIGETTDLIKLISAHKPGETVNLKVLREAGERNVKEIPLKVKLIDRSETLRTSAEGPSSEGDDEGGGDEEKPATAANLGFTVTEITPTVERGMRLPRQHVNGVVITKVSPESRAYEGGIRSGEIVTQIGQQPVTNLGDFRLAAQKIKPGQVVKVSVTVYLEDGTEAKQYVFFAAD